MDLSLRSASKKINHFLGSSLDLNKTLKNAYGRMSFADRFIFILFAVCYALSSVWIVYNQLDTHYSNLMLNLLLPPAGIGGFLVLYILCLNYLESSPYASHFFIAVLYTALFCYAMFLTCGSAMLTPSTHLLNQQLKQWDLALGFHQLPLIIWTSSQKWLHKILLFAYASWPIQIGLACPVLALCKQYKHIKQWTIASIAGILIVSIIYFIYPSLPPASVYPEFRFADGCYECINRFYLLHAYQPFILTSCGLIVFPSCHVIYALFTTYAFRGVKWILWPLSVLNIALIASTLMLGMHFLSDVLGAVVVFAVCSLIAHWATKRGGDSKQSSAKQVEN